MTRVKRQRPAEIKYKPVSDNILSIQQNKYYKPIHDAVSSSAGMGPACSFNCGSKIAEKPNVEPAAKPNKIGAEAAKLWKQDIFLF